MDKIKTDKFTLRSFGLVMALVFCLMSLFLSAKDRQAVVPTAIISLLLMSAAIFAPVLLKYFYVFWMRLAYLLSWINTRLLLGLIFYFIFSPVGLFMRLFKIDLLERNFKTSVNSYWKVKTGKKALPEDYRRQS